MRPIIHSVKHYIQFTEFNVSSGSVSEHLYADAVPVTDVSSNQEVQEGSSIKAIFIELWLTTDSSTSGTFVVTVEKTQQNAPIMTFSEMTTLNFYDNKKNILFTSQGILAGEGSGNPTPVLRQWIKIPKGKQRFGHRDQLRMNIASIGSAQLVGCSFATYKEYT